MSDSALDTIRPFNVDRDAWPAEACSYFEAGTREKRVFAAFIAIVNYISELSQYMGKFKGKAYPRNRKRRVRIGVGRLEQYQKELSRSVL